MFQLFTHSFLKRTEKVLLDYLTENENITLSKFRRIAGISKPVAEKVLVDLITLKIIKMDFTEKDVFYRIIPDFEENKRSGGF
jgi:predicted HTH transcriptional regulator